MVDIWRFRDTQTGEIVEQDVDQWGGFYAFVGGNDLLQPLMRVGTTGSPSGAGGDEVSASPQTIGLNPEDVPGVSVSETPPRPDEIAGGGSLTPEMITSGFANPDSFSPESRFGFTLNPDGTIGGSGEQFSEFGETGNQINTIRDAVEISSTLTPDEKASLTTFLDMMAGPLFGEDGLPIFADFPSDLLGKLLSNPELSANIGPIFTSLIASRSNMVQNSVQQATALRLGELQANPFDRNARQDAELQALIASGGISHEQALQMQAQRDAGLLEQTQAQFNPLGFTADQGLESISRQFNPFGFDQGQGLESISRQFNPFAETASDRLALQKAQFNPFGQTAADQLALQQAQFNPFGRDANQDAMLQADIARGGLSSAERLLEIQAANRPQTIQNMLGFLGDPSAVGSAVALGGQGFLNQLTGQQGGQQASNLGQQAGGALFNPTAPTPTGASLRGFSDEGIELLQGSAAGQGVTPSRLAQLVGSVTPGGASTQRGAF
jgi:hypothetical protein